jgi:uncharacterized protein YndB with AHSA1/START domain
MSQTLESSPDLRFFLEQQTTINASVETVFDAILAEMCAIPDREGKPMGHKLEAWPGGRWYRDLGNNAGHLWGHVQVIKPPKLLEICGPLMMPFAAINHVSYRLTPNGKSTDLLFRHRALGEIPEEMAAGMKEGWGTILEQIRTHAEK